MADCFISWSDTEHIRAANDRSASAVFHTVFRKLLVMTYDVFFNLSGMSVDAV